MNIKPLRDNVIVRRVEEEKTTTSGLIIPDSASEKPSTGEVLAVGNGAKNSSGDTINMEVKVGDKILFSQFSSNEITVDGEKLLVMSEADITAIVT